MLQVPVLHQLGSPVHTATLYTIGNHCEATRAIAGKFVTFPPRHQGDAESLILLIERYLEGEPISREEVIAAMKQAILDGEIVPLFVGSGELTYGMRALLTKMVELLPAPDERPAPLETGLLGRVFKTVSEYIEASLKEW